MTFRHAETVRGSSARGLHGRKPGPFRALGQRLNWVATRPIYAQIGLVGLLTAVTVILAFPAAAINYSLGDVSRSTIRADRGFKVADLEATKLEKQKAADKVAPVFMLDDVSFDLTEEEVAAVFQRGREILAAKIFPRPGENQAAPREDDPVLADLKEAFLQVFRLPGESPVWEEVIGRGFNESLERHVLSLADEIMALGLMDRPNPMPEQWRRPVTIIVMSSRLEYTVPSVMAIMDMTGAERYLQIKARMLQTRFSPEETNLIVKMAAGLLKPNLSPDHLESRLRVEEAVKNIPEAYFMIRAGEVIVREGSIITPDVEAKLRAIQENAGAYNWLLRFAGLFMAMFIFLNAGLILSNLSPRGGFHSIPVKEQLLTTALLSLAAFMSHSAGIFGAALSWDFDFIDGHTFFYAMPIAAMSMLIAVFFGIRKAAFMALFAAMISTIVAPADKFIIFIYTYNGSIAAIWRLRNMNERGRLIPAAVWVALINCLTLLSLTLFSDAQWGRQTVYNFCAAALSGLSSGIIASGMIPLLEWLFGFSTNLKMLELGNLDRPILRKLMLTAPGTYHHSVIVGAMVEAAAEAIGANPHLAKVGAYYHDIGKLKKPLYFVENQTGENRHDTLSPSMSALILIGHVKEGVELALENKLPQTVVDIVEQHHGASLMSFFYHKAREQRQEGQPEVNESDYRYPGPRPHSKEAGLVMMADICEAATRSLSEPTPAKIQNLVRHLVNQIFSDGQLDGCDIMVKEIAEVVNTFTMILIGIYHHRVAYPGAKKAEKPPVAEEGDDAREPEAGRPDGAREISLKETNGHLPLESTKGAAH
ncbi:MAG: HDIG domain-containing protein [Candidatus Adiutrix sp.]|jgi:putative nucleotidyltransferase with HDIG domain|nr:HDIG domain-containing protein [Candidatus Adiutrix sp.]